MKNCSPSNGQNCQLVHWWVLVHSGHPTMLHTQLQGVAPPTRALHKVALTPSAKPLGWLSTFAPRGMLDLSWTLALDSECEVGLSIRATNGQSWSPSSCVLYMAVKDQLYLRKGRVVVLGYEGYQLQWIFPTKLNPPHVSDNAISTYYSTSHITNLPHMETLWLKIINITFQFNQVFVVVVVVVFFVFPWLLQGFFFFPLQFCAFKTFVIFLRFLKKNFSNWH